MDEVRDAHSTAATAESPLEDETLTPFDDHQAMAHALRLARKGLFSTDPNPRVGCVLVRDGRVVGEGWHERAGEAHAEVHALRSAGDAARGATAYTTLEPCSHVGRTGPCTHALLAAGVTRVVCAMRDPDPRVSGRGIEELRRAGLDVVSGVLEEAAQALNAGYVKRMRTGMPWVRVKLAMSLDGRTATADGESQWITSAAARDDVQYWRARSGAVLTGSGTLQADDPRLDVRRPDLVEVSLQPWRAVLDSRLQIAPSARVLGSDGRAVVFHVGGASVPPGLASVPTGLAARLEEVPADEHGRCDLRAALRRLAELGANEVLVEPGATLAGALAAQGLVDEWLLYVAPRLLGQDARGWLTGYRTSVLADALALEWKDVRRVGADLRIRAIPAQRD